MSTWDPERYLRFAGERSRPFFDLLARVPDGEVRAAADLGCGTGALTQALAARWPRARIWGIDTSREMLSKAEAHPALLFECADLRTWSPPQPLDRLIANAVLQWLPDPAQALERMLAMLDPAGVLAVQVPHNADSPAVRAVGDLAKSPPWRESLRDVRLPRSESPQWYAQHLTGLGLHVDLWETVYWHRMRSPRDILEWLCGTTLLPVAAALDAAGWDSFRDALGQRLEAAYATRDPATWFPFRRLFFVASPAPLQRA